MASFDNWTPSNDSYSLDDPDFLDVLEFPHTSDPPDDEPSSGSGTIVHDDGANHHVGVVEATASPGLCRPARSADGIDLDVPSLCSPLLQGIDEGVNFSSGAHM